MVFQGRGDFTKLELVRKALDDNNMERFYSLLDAGLRGVPFTTFKKDAKITDAEAFYNAMVFYLLPYVLPKSYIVRPEETTSDGQSDFIIETPKHIFIIEHKILPKKLENEKDHTTNKKDRPLCTLLSQIKKKNYMAKYLGDGRPFTLCGVCFDGNTRGVGHVESEEWTCKR